MDREQLVEAMALAMANVRRAACKLPPLEYLTTVKLDEREALVSDARAALAVAEPAVREWCAVVADAEAKEAGNRAAIAKARKGLAEWPETRAQAAEEAAIRIARAIRTGGTTP